jgi:hypothetical protein
MRIALTQRSIILLAAQRVAKDGVRSVNQCGSLVITAEIGVETHLRHQGAVTRLDDIQRRIWLHMQYSVIVSAILHSRHGRLSDQSFAKRGK